MYHIFFIQSWIAGHVGHLHILEEASYVETHGSDSIPECSRPILDLTPVLYTSYAQSGS